MDCVSTQYRSRIKELNVLPVAPGRTSYTVSEYRILAPKTADETMANHTISFPQLTNKTSSDVLLNNWMARDIRKWRSGLENDSNSDLTVTLTKVTSELIQTTEIASFEGHGAAHPQMNVLYYYFLPSSGRVMQVTDFFTGSRWMEVVAQHIFAKLREKLGEQLLIKRAEELYPLISETSNWSIGDGTFSLEFNPYQVAPYSEGFVQVVVPMDLIRSYLTPFARGRLTR
jgi:hypothetical protein